LTSIFLPQFTILMADVCIIGAGLSGLACARELSQRGISWQILEATGRIGGRVATDHVDGFLLDRGFQVLLNAYPEAERVLDYGALNLRPFHSGAKIWLDNRFTTISNPLEHPENALSTLFAPIGSVADKFRILTLRNALLGMDYAQTLAGRERTTMAYLREFGFSERVIERFFVPFFGGVFFDNKLQTSSRMFEFVFRMFALGKATLPAAGMEQIPLMVASMLDTSNIHLNSPVQTLEYVSNGAASGAKDVNVKLSSGESIRAKAVIVATDWITAEKLTHHIAQQPVPQPKSRATTCLYFAAKTAPFQEPMLALNGTGRGLVNNLCVPSNIAPLYAPDGESLISASIIGIPQTDDETLCSAVRKECGTWFGTQVQDWRHIRTYRIEYALPDQTPPALSPAERPLKIGENIIIIGDYRATASIQGAMLLGRNAAQETMALS
jgi:phytoene dehydrogenase-like protein